jgi:fatty acid desaturase
MTERVRIVHPRTEAASRAAVPPALSPDTLSYDEVSIRSLIRGQARIAALVTTATAILLGGLAVLGAFWPASGGTKLVPWIVLGVLVYPLLISLGWFGVRQAERNEDAYRDIVSRR